MSKIKRFYHCPELNDIHTMRDCLYHSKKVYADKVAYRQYESNTMESAISFRGLSDNVEALGTKLLSMGLKGKHIAILGETSIEWMTAYFAILDGIGVAIPLDRELTDETMFTQINFGDVEAIFCSAKLIKRLPNLLKACPRVKTVIIMRETLATNDIDPTWHHMNKLLEEGRRALRLGDESYVNQELDPYAMAQIIFTSGTTGANKGVMLSQENIWTCGRGARQLVHYLDTDLSVLPIHHTYELSCNIVSCLYEGTTVCINDDLKHVLQNINHFKPELICMVPMMLDLLVRRTKKTIEENGLEKHVSYAMWFSNILRKIGIDRRRYFFKPILEKFGGNLTKIVCGGAPLAPETAAFLDAIGITVSNGYGITECAPLVSTSGDRIRRAGSVGQVLPTCKVRIADPDENGNGEIQVKGGNVMLGYYKAPEDTAAVFTEDGWFRTGDIGHLDRDNFLYLCGRIKNLIILSNGKNIFPEEIEDHLVHAVPYIEETVVFADDDNTGIYAICYLNPEFCKNNGLETEEQQYERLIQDVQAYNKKTESYKRLNNVYISMTPFEKTTTHKIKRFTVEKRGQHTK